jgi:uncharacterized membrane protein
MASPPPSRLAYIDWLRGLACVLMFQTHCYDAWMGGAARNSQFHMWSQLGGTFPAPLFLFLTGISFGLIVNKLLAKGLTANQIAKTTIRRGAEIFALGLLFRTQEFAISWGRAPWSDLFRVDILNTIGISIMLMGLVCWGVLAFSRPAAGSPARGGVGSGAVPNMNLVVTSILVATAISTLSPLLWTTWRPRFLAWEIETYINGVHNLGQPQAWLFPIFPWTAFAFAGLAFGAVLSSDFARNAGVKFFLAAGLAGLALIYLAKFLDSRSVQIYPVFDFWHTSPEFFMIRVGLLLLLTMLAYAWCQWGLGQWRFSPMIQMGKTSLLVYWVHIEFVYGKFSILPRRSQSILGASKGLLIIFLAMLCLSLLRTKLRGWVTQFPIWNRGFARPA